MRRRLRDLLEVAVEAWQRGSALLAVEGAVLIHGSCSRLFRVEEDMHFQTELISEAKIMMGLG